MLSLMLVASGQWSLVIPSFLSKLHFAGRWALGLQALFLDVWFHVFCIFMFSFPNISSVEMKKLSMANPHLDNSTRPTLCGDNPAWISHRRRRGHCPRARSCCALFSKSRDLWAWCPTTPASSLAMANGNTERQQSLGPWCFFPTYTMCTAAPALERLRMLGRKQGGSCLLPSSPGKTFLSFSSPTLHPTSTLAGCSHASQNSNFCISYFI